MRAEINFGTRKLKSKIPRPFYGDSGFRRNGARWWRRGGGAAGRRGGGAMGSGRRVAKLRTAAVSSFSPLTFVGGVSFREVYFALTFGMLDSRLRRNDGVLYFPIPAKAGISPHILVPTLQRGNAYRRRLRRLLPLAAITPPAVRRLILFIRYSIPAKAGISLLRARHFSFLHSSCRNLFRHGLIPRIIYYPPFIRLDGNKLPCKCVPK